MNDETYEALKVLVGLVKESYPHEPPKEIAMVEGWIDETAKEHEQNDADEEPLGKEIDLEINAKEEGE